MTKYFQNMDFVSHIPKISAKEKLGKKHHKGMLITKSFWPELS